MRRTALLLCLLAAAAALEAQAADPPGAGGGLYWKQRETSYFVFVYRERDRAFVRDLEAVAADSYRSVCGYFGFAPADKPIVVVYGDQDWPAYGGYCGPFPLRIALSAATSYSPRTLLTHEFTHWMNAMRPTGLMYGLGTVFGRDLSFLSLGFEFHFLEGVSSFMDGERADCWSELFYKAPLLEERMWSFEQAWTAGQSQPGALRIYLSGLLMTDYLYRHYGADAFARLHKRFADFPFAGDAEAIRYVTGRDPRLVWSDALVEARARFAADAALPAAAVLTPQESLGQQSWQLLDSCGRGLLVLRSSLDGLPEYGFYRPPYRAADGADRPGRWQPIRGWREPCLGAAVDAAGDSLVVARAPPAFSGRDDEAAASDLWKLELSENADGSLSARAKRLTLSANVSRPAYAPDGGRIYAIQRVSNESRLVAVDPASGQVTILLDATKAAGRRGDDNFSVARVAASPDGASLGLLLSRQGTTDVGLAAPDGGSLRWITRDAAMEYSPRFAADGSLQFASDRENAIVLYAYGADGAIRRVLRDRVGVWAAALWTPADGEACMVYQSYTAQGYALKSCAPPAAVELPGFADLVPDYHTRQEAIWRDLAAAAPAEPERAAAPKPVAGGAEGQGFVDIAKPVYWLPSLSWGSAGLGVGAQTVAASVLGGNWWSLGMQWLPAPGQLTGSLDFGLDQPGFDLAAQAALDYQATTAAGVAQRWQDRRLSLDGDLNLYADRSADSADTRIDASLGTLALWRVSRGADFNLVDSLADQPDFQWRFGSGLAFKYRSAAPASAVFGGGGFDIGGRFYLRPLLAGWGPAGGVDLGLQFALGASNLRLEGRCAVDAVGKAAQLAPADYPAWGMADGPWRLQAGVSWRLPLGFDPTPAGQFSVEQRGLVFGATTGLAFAATGAPQWDGYLAVRVEYRCWPLWYSAAVPVLVGAAWRCDPANPSLAGSLVLYFGVFGAGLGFGSTAAGR